MDVRSAGCDVQAQPQAARPQSARPNWSRPASSTLHNWATRSDCAPHWPSPHAWGVSRRPGRGDREPTRRRLLPAGTTPPYPSHNPPPPHHPARPLNVACRRASCHIRSSGSSRSNALSAAQKVWQRAISLRLAGREATRVGRTLVKAHLPPRHHVNLQIRVFMEGFRGATMGPMPTPTPLRWRARRRLASATRARFLSATTAVRRPVRFTNQGNPQPCQHKTTRTPPQWRGRRRQSSAIWVPTFSAERLAVKPAAAVKPASDLPSGLSQRVTCLTANRDLSPGLTAPPLVTTPKATGTESGRAWALGLRRQPAS